jgi:3-phenylpropionate/trans-cinnamate dioxygenase ferredoxin subunit
MKHSFFQEKRSFMDNFIKVADLSDVQENSLFPLEADGELICLTKIDGTIYAFTDNCTHISGPLNEGELEGCTITCPWHGAEFDVRTGKVLCGPARQDLVTYPVKVENDGIYISLPEA